VRAQVVDPDNGLAGDRADPGVIGLSVADVQTAVLSTGPETWSSRQRRQCGESVSDVTIPEAFRDLLDADVAILATNGADGLPQVTAIGFALDPTDGLVKISLNESRQKVKNLRRDPKTTLFILDRANPFRTLEIRAEAELVGDPGLTRSQAISAKYNADLGEHDGPGETRSVVVLHPRRVITTDIG
jgi:PPOX class probable F420-dependent enzyme